MSNKQGELEAMMQHENYDIVAITETWWMPHTTGVLQSMATSSSGGIDREGEVVEWPCMLENAMRAQKSSIVITGWECLD